MGVNGEPVESAHFGAEWESAGSTRRFVCATLRDWGCEALEYVVTLLASELVANAVLHAGTEIDVVLRRHDNSLRVEVHDGDQRLPSRKLYSITATTGRGLVLVDDLARDWGADVTPEGKCVWFDVDVNGMALDQALMGALQLDDWEAIAHAETSPGGAAIDAGGPADAGAGTGDRRELSGRC